ncbi:MAG: peptidyl-prolyl cis-trans isomerase [Deltaproteobacteria bacterium]|nr:peptidyl-prolyl cis-trans isomerase [Deltaproteobacteria bacterium]
MQRRFRLALFFFILTVSALFWLKAEAGDKDTLATAGSFKVTAKDLEDRLLKLPEGYRDVFAAEEGKKELLKEIIRIEVFSREARASGLHKAPSFRARIEDITNSLLAAEFVKRNIIEKVSVTEEETKEYFDSHSGEFREPEKIKAPAAFVRVPDSSPEEAVKEKEARAATIMERLKAGGDFTGIDEATGESDYFARGRLMPEIEDAVFSLKLGETSPVMRVPDGFVVFKLEDRRPERALSFEEVKNGIIDTLKRDKEKKEFESAEKRLFAKYKVSFNTGEEKRKASEAKKEDYIKAKISDVSRGQGKGIIGTILVNVADKKAEFEKAAIKVTEATSIFKERNGANAPAGFDDLKAGQDVKVLIEGPVLYTFPVQAKAKEIVITGE